MRAFQFFGEYDQLDMRNIVGLEVIMRRCQVIECHRERKAKSSESQDNRAGVSLEEGAYSSGTHWLAEDAMIAVELSEWAMQEIGRDADVEKKTRKVREEVTLSRTNA